MIGNPENALGGPETARGTARIPGPEGGGSHRWRHKQSCSDPVREPGFRRAARHGIPTEQLLALTALWGNRANGGFAPILSWMAFAALKLGGGAMSRTA